MTFLQVWSAVGPFVGACVGYGATYLTDARADARSAARARGERVEAKAEAWAAEQRTYEIEAIHATEAAIGDFVRYVFALSREPTPPIGGPTAYVLRLAACREKLLRQDLRDLVGRAGASLLVSAIAVPKAEPPDFDGVGDALNALGSRLRELYGAEASGDHSVTTEAGGRL